MSNKKSFVVGSMVILGLAVLMNGAFGQTPKNAFQNMLKTSPQLEVRFMDENCDGLNDLARDHDNDGIPNGQDSDWIKPQDGTGYKSGKGKGGQAAGLGAGGFRGQPGIAVRVRRLRRDGPQGPRRPQGPLSLPAMPPAGAEPPPRPPALFTGA